MVSNALTTSMSPKFTLFRDMGVRGWGGSPQGTEPSSYSPHNLYPFLYLLCVWGGYFLPQSKEERKEIGQRQGKGGFGMIPGPS